MKDENHDLLNVDAIEGRTIEDVSTTVRESGITGAHALHLDDGTVLTIDSGGSPPLLKEIEGSRMEEVDDGGEEEDEDDGLRYEVHRGSEPGGFLGLRSVDYEVFVFEDTDTGEALGVRVDEHLSEDKTDVVVAMTRDMLASDDPSWGGFSLVDGAGPVVHECSREKVLDRFGVSPCDG